MELQIFVAKRHLRGSQWRLRPSAALRPPRRALWPKTSGLSSELARRVPRGGKTDGVMERTHHRHRFAPVSFSRLNVGAEAATYRHSCHSEESARGG